MRHLTYRNWLGHAKTFQASDNVGMAHTACGLFVDPKDVVDFSCEVCRLEAAIRTIERLTPLLSSSRRCVSCDTLLSQDEEDARYLMCFKCRDSSFQAGFGD